MKVVKLVLFILITTVTIYADAPSNVKLYYGPHEPGEQFFCSIEVEQSAPGTFFECCGFDRGFTGLYEKADKKRGIVLRIWDVDGGRNKPDKVKDKKRASVVKSIKNSSTTRFGDDGSGAMIFFPFQWKENQKIQFLLKANIGEKETEFTALFYTDSVTKWQEVGIIKVANYGIEQLQSYYSSIRTSPEKTVNDTARKAYFSFPWIKQRKANWMAFVTGDFTADPPKDNINAGNTTDDRFFLETGGQTIQKAEIMASFSITVKPQPPEILNLSSQSK